MSKKKIFIIATVLIVLIAVVGLCVWLFGGMNTAGEAQTEPTQMAAPMTYSIEVKSEGGMVLEGVGVYVYTDSTQSELVWFAKTDAAGKISFTDVASDSYIAVLAGLPDGFTGEESYPVTGELTQIVLSGGLAVVEDMEAVTFELGDLITDFTVTTADGTDYTLSQLLKTKKAVILNFWYIQCVPCQQEFPFMQEAYELFSEDMEILAMNPVNQELSAIAEFQKEMDLTFPMVSCEQSWESAMQLTAYPTTVVIDRYGTIALIHKGTIPDVQTFGNIFAYFTADDYEQTVVLSVDDLPEAELELEGSINNPTEVGGVSSFEVTVKAGEEVHVNLYKANNLYLTINSANAYIICDNVTYKPGSGGTVGLIVKAPDTFTPVKLTFGNSGKKTEKFTIKLSQFAGSLNNPYSMKLGEFSASVNAGNDQGVYFQYVAEADGVLKAECLKATSGVDYMFILYNQTSMAYRTSEEDGSVDENGVRSVSVQVKKGDKIQFSVGTLPDSSNNYPGGEFVFRASLEEGAEIAGDERVELVKYSITVTDENRKPLPNVFFNVVVDGVIKTFGTNENGVASISLPAGTYDVTLVTPTGYKSDTTTFKMTEAFPAFSVKLDTHVIVTKTYTVKVVDEAQNPIPNALVSIESSFGYTDETGCVSLTLEEGQYTAMVIAPEGFVAENTGYPFPEGATELTITLKAGSSEDKPNDPTKPDYTVTVVDFFNKPKTDVVVQFWNGMELAAGVPVNAKGAAMAELDPGEYTVKLLFSGQTCYYEEPAALTAENSSVTIRVIPKVSGEYEELYVGNAYHVNVGGTYVQMQANVMNYYIFEPTVSGVYKFTTSDPAAKISYWGGSTAFISDLSASTDLKDNAFTRNIKEKNLGIICIIGITGADDCVLEITRIGDQILDETDVVPTIYKATTTPAAYTLNLPSGKKLINVNLTAATSTYNLVFNSADGYYHLNSANGPVMYVNLGPNAPYVSMYNLLGFTGFGGTALNKSFYDESGKLLKREDYTQCMMDYVECIDEKYGVYPLTQDLYYILHHAGEYKGWWDSSNGNYLFGEVAGFNPELGWMFACCYIG